MTILFDKLMLLMGCMLLMFYRTPETGIPQLLAFLWTVIFSCSCTCCNVDSLPVAQLNRLSRNMEIFLYLLFAGLSLLHPAFGIFLPFLFYELKLSAIPYLWIAALPLPFLSFRDGQYSFLVLLLYVFAWICAVKTCKLLELEKNFKILRDTTTEYNLLLNQKNKDLLEKQDYEIHVATLKERNRIAREIHDNVGHMLSRSILQSGALLAINQQEQLKEPLLSLKDSLTLAMNAIRESVHDLHDDAIDLEHTISGLFDDFTDYQFRFEYDMGPVVPASVKYCFIAIIKEALSNIAKHSNATEIQLVLREHPRLYQLTIEDNGNKLSGRQNFPAASSNEIPGNTHPFRQSPSGMGLLNMQERVESLHGHLSITTEQGFRIFVSIPHN